MKTLSNQIIGRRVSGLCEPLASILLLLLLSAPQIATADTPYTATGWVTGVSVPSILCTNALGQVALRGNVHRARVVSSDARLTGRRTIFVDGTAQADGSFIVYGPVYLEVGTWDATGTLFTATGGTWQINYRGTMGANGSLQLHLVGSGWGGAIDGLRLDETLTRTNGPNLDPTIPYLYTGTIKPALLETNQVIDNFDDNRLTDWDMSGNANYSNSKQQLTVRGWYPDVVTRSILDSYGFGWHSPIKTVPDGQTSEWRVDLVSLDGNAANIATLTLGTMSGFLVVHKSSEFVYLFKWPNFSIFSCEKVAIRNTNVILALALTRVQPNLVITVRVLDKADPNTVLYQRTVVDTPGVDPTLSTAQFQELTGMKLLDLGPDPAGAPFTEFQAAVGVFQYTDGTKPAVVATFDNLELRTSEVLGIGIERAVRLRWPASARLNYAVEGATTLKGPWLPVQDMAVPGLQQLTVPEESLMQVFRLRPAP